MSLTPSGEPTVPAETNVRDEKLLPLVGWITYIVGLGVVGLVIAYVDRGNARRPIRENYTYMIRTFWIGLLYAIVPVAAYIALMLHVMGIVGSHSNAGWESMKAGVAGGVPDWFLIAFAMQGVFLVVYLWFLARSIRGLVALVRDIPIPRPKTWFV